MGWIIRNIDWVLIISGAATCSMVTMALTPETACRFVFGTGIEGPVANLIARSWGIMIFAAGIMMVFAAYHAEARLPILLYAIVGKLSFVILTLLTPDFRQRLAAWLAIADIVVITLLTWYLIAAS